MRQPHGYQPPCWRAPVHLPSPGEVSISTLLSLPQAQRTGLRTGPRSGPRRAWAGPVAAWTAGRALLLAAVLGLLPFARQDVSSDVKVIYQGWAQLLATGTFPLDDVTWQYPPLAALVMLVPSWLPWSYFTGFLVLVAVCDALVLGLLLRAARRGGRSAGAWLWAAAVPLLGPTAYCRFDLVVTAVAVAGLLAAGGRPRLGGALAGLGALLKVWPALTLLGTPRGPRTRDAWTAAAVSGLAVCFCCAVTMVGGFSFLGFQEDRGVEVESLGALPFYAAHLFGWGGRAEMHYGSTEFLGTGVRAVGLLILACTLAAFGWLLLWRVRARRWTQATPFDAALAALLLFTVTSRVISPQYLVWLIGAAAVCLASAGTTQRPTAWLIAAATLCTYLEFPLLFGQLAEFRPLGVLVLCTRNLLLATAATVSCRRLWRATVHQKSG
ncbi:glycosyltransferase 87 family protein [Streptacidiphilus sp. N1-12]|uniref:Glycosyltransferase 87 family protein n=2 Tax=Streptacidiphilus alkalitolerans TaxID=3342712 RepID=A0ABV6VFH6_9ACTN